MCSPTSNFTEEIKNTLQETFPSANIAHPTTLSDLHSTIAAKAQSAVLWDCPLSSVPYIHTAEASAHFKQISSEMQDSVPQSFRDTENAHWIGFSGNVGIICADPKLQNELYAKHLKSASAPRILEEIVGRSSTKIGVSRPFSITGFNWIGMFELTGSEETSRGLNALYSEFDGHNATCDDILSGNRDVVFSSLYAISTTAANALIQGDLALLETKESWFEPNIITVGKNIAHIDGIEKGIQKIVSALDGRTIPVSGSVYTSPFQDGIFPIKVDGQLVASPQILRSTNQLPRR